MTLANWAPALTTTTLFGVVVWLAKNVIVARLRASVVHEFESKIEGLRSDLRTRESEIAAIREVSRGHQSAVEARRLPRVS